MRIIVGHTNMDLDCLGSLVLARRLFPGFSAVSSRLIHPVARTLYNLYKDNLGLLPFAEVAREAVEEIVVVDTRSFARVREYLEAIRPLPERIRVFDHHSEDESDIPGAIIQPGAAGANTTLVGLAVMANDVDLTPEEATVALAGIYADTGNFTHENVTSDDFAVASWLSSHRASVRLVRTFLQALKGESQISLFHDLLNRLTYQTFHGNFVVMSYMEMERQTGGLAAIVDKVFEVESPDALFCVFHFTRENDTLIIGRSQKGSVDLTRTLSTFGGGGHPQASSALVRKCAGRQTYHALRAYLLEMLAPAPTAESIMSRDVKAVRDTWTLREASVFLEELDRTGAPVVDAAGNVCGFLSLRDIMKGRRSGQMHAPVRSYMTRSVFTASPSSTLREIETAFFQHTIFYLPVVEDRRLVGIVTRSAYLAARAGEPEAGAAAAAAQPAAEPARSGPEIRPGGNSDPRRG